MKTLEKRIRALEDHRIKQDGKVDELCKDTADIKTDLKGIRELLTQQHDFMMERNMELYPTQNFVKGFKWGLRIIATAILVALVKPIWNGILWAVDQIFK